MISCKRRWMSVFGRCRIPEPYNEPMLGFGPGSRERNLLQAAIQESKKQVPEIPCIVHGQAIKTGNIGKQVMPTNHSHPVGRFHQLDEGVVKDAIKSSLEAKQGWMNMPFEQRASIFLKAADLLVSPKYRWKMMSATMLGQGKNVWQAEIDCIAEMADFWRFNVKYAEEIYNHQPKIPQSDGVWNRLEHRPLEGFVVSIGPFNFSAIGANLASAPAIMGNTVIFKPSEYAMASNYIFHEILTEAGLPPGVINFLPGDGKILGDIAFKHPDFAGLHFTGSTNTFNNIWKSIASNVDCYKSYPVVVGETGGKNFHFVHESASLDSVVNQTIRGAFEYQGQKCSATSRLYVPNNRWDALRELLLKQLAGVKKGCVTKFDCLVNAVINQQAYDRISGFIERARSSDECKIIYGGSYDDSEGYFIEPTVIVTTNPKHEIMQQEIFGPVLSVYIYDHQDLSEALKLCNSTSGFGLTGAIFAKDREAIDRIQNKLKYACGNLYINDKSTGAIVGQQPFGGSRKSGTNDKSGSSMNLYCWVSPQTIKETFLPLRDYRYRHMF